MKAFPLEPLRRVRDLRLEAQQRVVAERRTELEQAEQRHERARQARTTLGDRRRLHLEACIAAVGHERLAPDWLDRAERHRQWLDQEILRADGAVAAVEREVSAAQARLAAEIATLRRVQAKVDALATFRDDWLQARDREQERRDESDAEELFRAPSAAAR